MVRAAWARCLKGLYMQQWLKWGLNRAPYLVVSIFYFFVLYLISLLSFSVSLGLLSIVSLVGSCANAC